MMNWNYTVIMFSAITISVLISRHTQKGLALTFWQKAGLGLGAYCGAMIAAKLPFVFSQWEGFLSGAAWFSNGKTILCGLVGGYAGVETAKWAMLIKTNRVFELNTRGMQAYKAMDDQAARDVGRI